MTIKAQQLLEALKRFEEDVPSIEAFPPATFKAVTRLRESIYYADRLASQDTS